MTSAPVRYINVIDYRVTIQKEQLIDQLLDELEDGDRQREAAEDWAITIVRNKLGVEFNLDMEFTPTLPFDADTQYYAGNRVIIDYDEWQESKEYNQNDCVIKDGIGYICLSTNSDSAFDESKWQNIGKQYTIWNIAYPYPVFSLNVKKAKGVIAEGYYKVGDKVWWNNRIYTCLVGTIFPSHETVIQSSKYSAVPSSNVFPNDTFYGSSYWKDEGEYLPEKGQYPAIVVEPESPSIWTLGDNRNQLFVQAVIDLALWLLHSRISPENIPRLREDKKNYTFAWLQELKDGKQTSQVPRLQPEQGRNIRWGGKIKQNNGY